MALILPEIKHEYIFKEDTQEQKESTFEQCLDDGKEAAYAGIGTDPLDSTYIAAPDILPDHEMEYTSTDQHDYLKTIELVWGYTIGIITTPVVLNADTGDILAEGDAVDGYTAPEGVNTKRGRWIRLSGNRNLHPTVLRAVEMSEDVICLKDLCAAIQIDEKTGFTVEGFDSSHVINFDNAFQKAWINSEVTFDMSSCKTCKYMFNEGLIKDNSGELLTIQNMQPGTNCDYMFYNSYLYRIPEGIRQAGVGGSYMFCDAMLGRKEGLDNNTSGYKGILAERMFYQSPTSQYIQDGYGSNHDDEYYTGMYNTDVNTTDMIFTSCYPNISCALVGVSGSFPQINFAGVTNMCYLHSQVSGTKSVNTIDLSTIDQPKVIAHMLINFNSNYADTFNIIGNPEGTALCGNSEAIQELNNRLVETSLFNLSFRRGYSYVFSDSPEGTLTVNITNTLRLYELDDVYWKLEEIGFVDNNPMCLINNYPDTKYQHTLKITGNIQTLFLCAGVSISPESSCSVYQSYFSTIEEFERFVSRNVPLSSTFRNFCIIDQAVNDDSLKPEDLNLNCFNFENVFYVDRIVPYSLNKGSATTVQELLCGELTINKNNKPFIITKPHSIFNTFNIQNPSVGFIYTKHKELDNFSIDRPSSLSDCIKTQINVINDDEIDVYYRYSSSDSIYLNSSTVPFTLQIFNFPNANLKCISHVEELILKDCLDITVEVPIENCNKQVEDDYYFNTYYYSSDGYLMINSFRNFTSNQCFQCLGLSDSITNFQLQEYSHEEMQNTKIYFFPAIKWFDYNTFDTSQIINMPNLNIDTSGNYVIIMPNSVPMVSVKNYPLSYLPHTIYQGDYDTRYNRQYLPVISPFYTDSNYSIKFDVDNVNIQCNKYGQTELGVYCFTPSSLQDVDLSASKVGGGTWANGHLSYYPGIPQECTVHDYYLPTLNSCGFRVYTTSSQEKLVPISNQTLIFEHKYVSTTSCREIQIIHSAGDKDNREHLCPNLETIKFTGAIKNWSLTYNPCNDHVENVLKNIVAETTYDNSNQHNILGNIDLRWSQGITSETLEFLVNANYKTNSIVTINTIPYKLLTTEQIQTLTSKVTLTEYIPQEEEL